METNETTEQIISGIKEAGVRRRQIIKAMTKLDLQIQAICRGMCDGDKVKGAALAKAVKDGDAPETLVWLTKSLIAALDGLKTPRKEIERELAAHADRLIDASITSRAIREFIANTRGLAMPGLSQILGEVGYIRNYSSPGKLWKRLGIGTFSGGRQQCPKGVDQETALAIGYNKFRRSTSWVVFDSLLRAQAEKRDKETGEVLREAGPYRKIYDARKIYEREKDPEAKPIAIDRRAKRYAEKRFIRDLWCAWNADRVTCDDSIGRIQNQSRISASHPTLIAAE
jgi:hypothetical protein